MKLKQLRITSLFLFFVFALTATAQDVKENLENFTEVKTFNGVEIQLIPSEENRIEITGHSKNDVKFGVTQGRLEIKLPLDNIWSQDNTRITVYGNSITTIDANQGSLVEVSGELEAEELTFRVQEGSNIKTVVKARKIFSKAVTGGKITLKGKAEIQEVELNTGGHFYGRDLRTTEATVSAGTAGKAEVYVTNYVKATAKLGGTIELFGRPKEVDTKTSLGGRIL